MSTVEHVNNEAALLKKNEEAPTLVITDDIREEAARRLKEEKPKPVSLDELYSALRESTQGLRDEVHALLRSKAEAEAAAKKREAAIAAEMERLKQRTATGVLEEMVAELQKKVGLLEQKNVDMANSIELMRSRDLSDVWANIEKIMKYQSEYASYASAELHRAVCPMRLGPSPVCPAPPSVSKKQQ